MKNIIITLLMIGGVLFYSCKKTYNCTCMSYPKNSGSTNSSTVTNSQSTGFTNQIHYSIKSRNSDGALSKCQGEYENSGYVVNTYSCSVY